ncbi:MAG: helix-turn-helix domain-containing protein, partial [Lachnospiraceae bacterium]|nr:helix-turn-helix domain-containing protein [Lachnospiraceae bacterium]
AARATETYEAAETTGAAKATETYEAAEASETAKATETYEAAEASETSMARLRSWLSVQAPYCSHELLEDGGALFLLSFRCEADYRPMLYELNILLHFISEQNNRNYYVGVERFLPPESPEPALEHAAECLELLGSIRARRGVCSYENLTFVRMFGLLHQNEHSIVLDNQALQLLLNYDRRNQTNYVHTLRAYLADNCNISRTAERLFIHRHTLMKRLAKIHELCSIDFGDYYARLYMSLALLFHDYFSY